MEKINTQSLLILITLTVFSITTSNASAVSLERIAIFEPQSSCYSAEIISIQENTQRMVLSCSTESIVEIISIENPAKPQSLNHFIVSSNEEISAVSFHPTENVFAVAVINNDPFSTGKIQIHNATSGELLNTYDAGVHPDGLEFSPNGKYLVVANEGEAYHYNGKEYESPEGSVTLVDFSVPANAKAIQINLPDLSEVEGMMHKKHERKFERVVTGGNSYEEIKIAIKDNTPANTEPEFVTFSPDSAKAYVSLQENNGVLVIDTAQATIESVFGLGTTTHLADIKDNEKVNFDKEITALREPDGINISPDGRYLLTADEGDTDPKASKTLGNKPKGGGRTLSVFDALNGNLIADTGNQLDEMAHAEGLYPDDRSDNKGSEPENVISFTINNTLYAAVGLERADAIALVSLEEPSQPKVITVEGVDPNAGKENVFAPEGLAYYETDGKHYIYSANEKSGTMTVMEIKLDKEHLASSN